MLVLNADTGVSMVQDNSVTSAKIVDATIQQGDMSLAASSIGVNQTWQNMTASRALGTTYTNTTGKPIQTVVGCTNTTVGVSLNILINGALTLYGSMVASAGYNSITPCAVIPNGATYSVNSSGGTPANVAWSELR